MSTGRDVADDKAPEVLPDLISELFFSKDFFLENYYKSWLDNKFSQSQSIQNIYNNHSNKNKKGKILDTRTKNVLHTDRKGVGNKK